MTEFYNKILVFYNFLKHYLNLIDQLFFEILRFRRKIEKKKKKKGKKLQPKKKSLNCFKSGRNDDFRFIIWLLMVKTISTITNNAWCIFNVIFPLIFRF